MMDDTVDMKNPPKLRCSATRDNEFSDPVFKKLSLINGKINRKTKDELKIKLAELALDTRGVKEVLRKRLKNYYRRQKLAKSHVMPAGGTVTPYDFLLVIDFEATCEQDMREYQHEIIEFPVIVVNTETMQKVDEFHAYCKPTLNHRLSAFCTQLTGITQSMVDSADPFPVVLENFEEWRKSKQLGSRYTFSILCDGPWDMSRFLYGQCLLCGLEFPTWANKWINLRKIFANFYECKRQNLTRMLEFLGLKFKGTLHCGRDDANNIAEIALRLLTDGAVLRVNERIQINCGSEKPYVTVEQVKPPQTHTKTPRFKPDAGVNSDQFIAQMAGLELDDKEDEQIDDLLEYYRLQTS